MSLWTALSILHPQGEVPRLLDRSHGVGGVSGGTLQLVLSLVNRALSTFTASLGRVAGPKFEGTNSVVSGDLLNPVDLVEAVQQTP